MFFSSWNLSLGVISTNFWQAKYCTILVPFGPLIAICYSASSQTQDFGFILDLPVKWLLYLPTCLFSSYGSFCLLFSDLFRINSFCCWTFKTRSRNSIRWCHVCSSFYSNSQIVDSHLLTHLSPIIWYILSNPSPLYNLDLMLFCPANWYISLIILIILLKASTSFSWSLIFHSWLIFLICDNFFFSSNIGTP